MIGQATIPAGLQASLAALPAGATAALLLRHSDRAAVADGDPGGEVPLTPVGEARAHTLSVLLRARGGVGWVDSSPHLRCAETGRRLAGEVRACALLGSPGPFVVDREEGARIFGTVGTERVVRLQMAGHQWPFMRLTGEGARLLVDHARTRLADRPGLGALISHDAIIMPFVSVITGDRFAERWLDPLDGVILMLAHGGHLRALWRGHQYAVPA
ncbi:MAG TPA: hypothetical protein VGQ83_29655 [Polyangia bacterium]|jgi:hypothetical protein